jgi:peptidoglycan/LPS O-acetylase OafA/YrhL
VATAGGQQPRAEVPDVVKPPPGHPHFPLSQGLRALPALAILFGHAWLFDGGFGGFSESIANRAVVRLDGLFSLFFLLSAFLLYRPMIAHRAGGPQRPRIADYGLRRILRIYPAYWLALAGLAIVPGLFGVFSDKWYVFFSLTQYFNLGDVREVCPGIVSQINPGVHCGLVQTWSMQVEVTFYLALPLYAALTGLLARGRDVRTWVKLELALLAALAALSLFLTGPPFDFKDDPWFLFSLAGHFYWFALGLAVAVLSVAYPKPHLPGPLRLAATRPLALWGAAAAIYVATVLLYRHPIPFALAPFTALEYVSLIVLQGIGTTLLLLPAVFGNPNRGIIARVLTNPVLMWFGVISYGIALWHVVIMADLSAETSFWPVFILGSLITIPIAAISYYLVERPLMKFKYRSPRDVFRRWREGRKPPEAAADAGGSA